MSALRIGLIGNGKMGRMIDSICAQDERFVVAGFVGPGACQTLGELTDLDVALDFSYPGNVTMMLEDALRRNLPLVIGTTGLSEQQEDQIRAASAQLPIVRALNFSTGMAVMRRLARMASDALREDFDIEIVETHHNQKEDAPSGSAVALLQSVDLDGEFTVVCGREGRPGKRGHEIGVHSLRGGTVAGEHTVSFFGEDEVLEITHRAASRKIFAAGALRAAEALAAKPAGWYSLEELLF